MALGIELVGDGLAGPVRRRRRAARTSTSTLPPRPARCRRSPTRVAEFLPWYSSVHRGAGYKSQLADGRLRGRPRGDPALRRPRRQRRRRDHLPQHHRGDQPPRLPAAPRAATTSSSRPSSSTTPTCCRGRGSRRCRFVECDADGTFDAADVARGARRRARAAAARDHRRLERHRLAAAARGDHRDAHARGIPVLVDAAQLAPHRPLPRDADFVAFSGHKMYAPFGAGALIGPRAAFAARRPVPRRRRRRRPRRPRRGRLDTHRPTARRPARPTCSAPSRSAAAARELERIGWDGDRARTTRALAGRLRAGLAAIPGVRVLGPRPRRRDAPDRHVHRRRRPARARRRPPERRVRHRRAPRLLLRPPLPHPPARASGPTIFSASAQRRATTTAAPSPARSAPPPVSRRPPATSSGCSRP